MGCNDSKPKTGNNKNDIKIKSDEKKVSKEYEIKICLLGDVSVGKTSIASRFCKNSFNENYINKKIENLPGTIVFSKSF